MTRRRPDLLPDLAVGDWVQVVERPCIGLTGTVIEVLRHASWPIGLRRYVVRFDEPLVGLGGEPFTDLAWGRESLYGPIRLVDRIGAELGGDL